MHLELQAREHIDIRTCCLFVTSLKRINSGDADQCGTGFDCSRVTAAG